MTFETFALCIEAVRRSQNPEYLGKKFVWLNHFGEPLLNPLLPDFIAHAVANDVEVSFFSNGVDLDGKLFPRSLWRDLARAGLKAVALSAHVKSRGVLERHVEDIIPVIYTFQPKREHLHDWAGQVKLEKLKPRGAPSTASGPCDYETQNMFVVRWDGVLTACCYDIEGGGLGDIRQVLQSGFEFKRIPLCSRCTLGRGDAKWIEPPPLISASYEVRLSERIDLNRPDLPSVVRAIIGLSFMEDWGRWSDANISKAVEFHSMRIFRKETTSISSIGL